MPSVSESLGSCDHVHTPDVPTLALQILKNNKLGNSNVNFKSIAVGNGVVGFGAQNPMPIAVDILYGHALCVNTMVTRPSAG